MKTGDLDHALEFELCHDVVGLRQEIVVIGKMRERMRMDQQRRFACFRIGRGQCAKLGHEVFAQPHR
jgi:hypothetical protein